MNILVNKKVISYRCDMHPHPLCADGEDEIGCFDQYIDRGFVPSSADYVCQSPYHNDETKTPTVNIYLHEGVARGTEENSVSPMMGYR